MSFFAFKKGIGILSDKKILTKSSSGREIATIGGGCFWCMEAVFSELKGIHKVESGYSGGTTENPTYDQICTGKTGHAEVIQIIFDPKLISYNEILYIFFSIHDPTTPNRQGEDIGTQYRSVIFFHDNNQKEIAEQVIDDIENSKIFNGPIITQLEPFKEFYRAEVYHQEYYKKNPNQPYCKLAIAPKLSKIRKKYFKNLKKS